MIQVAIIDDKPELLKTFSEALSFFEEVKVIFTARHGKEAIDKVNTASQKPDVILMDIEMDVMDGIAATTTIKKEHPNIKIIMLTVLDNEDKIFEAIVAGASGYLLKDERPTKILQAIEDAHEGRMPMSPLVASKTLFLLKKGAENSKLKRTEDFNLTPREIEILEHIAQGKTYRQIAEKIFVSPKTVRNHIQNIYKKLQVNSKTEAINIATQNKWFNKLSSIFF